MMRSRFEEQLSLLNNELLEMGALIEHAIEIKRWIKKSAILKRCA
jgi:phosphate uptake regulator